MANTLKFGSGQWATKVGSTLAYNDEGGNFKPLPFNFTRSTSATRVNKDGLIEVVTNNKPRIDFLNDSNGALLLEPQRTNLLLRSEEFDNASWVKLGQGTGSVPIVTPNYAISPDGTQNASRLQCDLNGGNTTSDRSWLYQSITDVVVESTFSLYVKNISSQTIIFTLNNGSSGTVSVTADSQWHRLYSVKTGGTQPRIGLIGGSGASDTADLLIYGAQLEAGSYATSYIPTQGATATRVAEVCNDAGNSQIFNDSEGVLFAEVSTFADNTYKRISLNNGSYVNSVVFDFIDDNNLYGKIFVGGSQIATILASGLNIENNNKLAFKYKQNDFALWVNGVQVGVDTSGSTPSGLNTLSLDLAGNQDFYGNTKQIQYFNTALNDSDLETLTSWDSFSDMATSQLYTIE